MNETKNKNNNFIKTSESDSIVLFAKQSGPTSFKSLNIIKKSLQTKKVGHTGTLDSFAQGLLVVCTGKLTKLAGCITEFNKSYIALIKFGEETDTLEKNGSVIKTESLPTEEKLLHAIKKFNGPQKQIPPSFSAIHVDGKRASDLTRKGVDITLPSRDIEIYSSKILDIRKNKEDKVEYCLIEFTVSKGTYIRSLARDIAYECGSVAHLVGLYRTKVGNFSIENSAGYDYLLPFTIDNVINNVILPTDEDIIKKQILEKKLCFTKEIALECGFLLISLIEESFISDIKNGKSIKNKMFTENLFELPNNSTIAVFYKDSFIALLEKDSEGHIKYKFVM